MVKQDIMQHCVVKRKSSILECSYFDSLLDICYFVAFVQIFQCEGLIAQTDVWVSASELWLFC